jgi:hypothetical protein
MGDCAACPTAGGDIFYAGLEGATDGIGGPYAAPGAFTVHYGPSAGDFYQNEFFTTQAVGIGNAQLNSGSGSVPVHLTGALLPEPVSSTLFVIGAATMGFRAYRKKRHITKIHVLPRS